MWAKEPNRCNNPVLLLTPVLQVSAVSPRWTCKPVLTSTTRCSSPAFSWRSSWAPSCRVSWCRVTAAAAPLSGRGGWGRTPRRRCRTPYRCDPSPSSTGCWTDSPRWVDRLHEDTITWTKLSYSVSEKFLLQKFSPTISRILYVHRYKLRTTVQLKNVSLKCCKHAKGDLSELCKTGNTVDKTLCRHTRQKFSWKEMSCTLTGFGGKKMNVKNSRQKFLYLGYKHEKDLFRKLYYGKFARKILEILYWYYILIFQIMTDYSWNIPVYFLEFSENVPEFS